MKVILTNHNLGVMDEATQALFVPRNNACAIALGAVTLRLREQLGPVFACNVDESAGMAEVVELHGYSRKVGA